MGIKDVLNSSYEEDEPDERLSVTGGPGIPDEELPDGSSEPWKKEYLKRGTGVLGAAATLYTGYEIGTSAGTMTVEDFIEAIEPSVEQVLEGAVESGADAAMMYSTEATGYAAEVAANVL